MNGGLVEEPPGPSSASGSMLNSGWSSLRSTFQSMPQFSGDLFKAVRDAPTKAASSVSQVAKLDGEAKGFDVEGFLRQKVEVGLYAVRDAIDTTTAVGEVGVQRLGWLSSGSLSTDAVLEPPSGSLPPSGTASASTAKAPAIDESSELHRRPWLKKLQSDVTEIRASHETRRAEMCGLDGLLDSLRGDIVLEQERLRQAEEAKAGTEELEEDAWRELEELQEAHQALLSRKAFLEAELRRGSIAADLAARAGKKARDEGAWARDGPETEALKEAKVALAQVMTYIDEARLQERRELTGLMNQIEAVQTEQEELLLLRHLDASRRSSSTGYFSVQRF